jgi:hypothetical protein
MGLSTLFTALVLVATYQLGVHCTRHPGDVTQRMARGWKWLWEQRN